MPSKEFINSDFFESLKRNIPDVLLVIDSKGNILSFNRPAQKFFESDLKRDNLFDLVSSDFAQYVNKCIISGIPNEDKSKLTLRSGETKNIHFSISPLQSETGYIFSCIFKKEEFRYAYEKVFEFSRDSIIGEEFLKNEPVSRILEEIKNNFPFTFIIKEKLRKSIDKLGELFWIKDHNNNFILVNNKFADILNLRPDQIEGENEDTFVPPVYKDFQNGITALIKNSNSVLKFNQLPYPGIKNNKDYGIILFPLLDSEKKNAAYIGIGRKIIQERSGLNTEIRRLLDSLPFATIYIGEDENLEFSNKEFSKLIPGISGSISSALPEKIRSSIKEFIKQEKITDRIEFEGGTEIGFDGHFVIHFRKVFYEGKENPSILLLLEEIPSVDDFEKILKRRGIMFEILLNSNPEPIFIYDKENLGFLEVNEAALNLYGYRKEEFLQMDLTDLYIPEDIQTLLDTSDEKSKEGKFAGPYRHKKKDGSFVYVEISKATVKFNEKDAMINIVKDVTERIELEKKNQLFKAAFDNTEQMVFITDADGIINFTNHRVSALLDYTNSELELTSFTALAKDNDRAIVNNAIFQSHFKESVTLTIDLKHADGSYLQSDLTATPVFGYNNEVDSYSIIANVKKETELPKEIIKEVYIEKAVPFTEPSPTEKPEKSKVIIESQPFLRSVFHELLTPINVILGFVQEFTENINNPNPEQKEAADIINQNRITLLDTMNSIIEYTNIQKKSIELKIELTGITEIFDEINNEIAEIQKSRNIDIIFDLISDSIKFSTDKYRFKNLIKYLFKISSVISKEKTLFVSIYNFDENNFSIRLRDTQTNVTSEFKEIMESIFNPDSGIIQKDLGFPKLTLELSTALLTLLKGKYQFIETEDRNECCFIFPMDFEGAAVELLEFNFEETIFPVQADVNVESLVPGDDVDTKASYEEEFPAEDLAEKNIIYPEPEEETLIEEPEPKPETKQMHYALDLSQFSCLYIEDQVDSQILFKVQMKDLKEVKFAVGFEDALPLLDNCHFDFIVMDINLQGEYNGLDALKIIHKMPAFEKIPIIAVTAYVLPGDKEKFIEAGFNDFISKPIFRDKMIESLEKIFEKEVFH